MGLAIESEKRRERHRGPQRVARFARADTHLLLDKGNIPQRADWAHTAEILPSHPLWHAVSRQQAEYCTGDRGGLGLGVVRSRVRVGVVEGRRASRRRQLVVQEEDGGATHDAEEAAGKQQELVEHQAAAWLLTTLW